jgi:hypothetical protein
MLSQVWVTPFQWSFPLNLPPQFFGIFPAGELVSDDTDTPWGDEIEQKLLLPPPIGKCVFVQHTRTHGGSFDGCLCSPIACVVGTSCVTVTSIFTFK